MGELRRHRAVADVLKCQSRFRAVLTDLGGAAAAVRSGLRVARAGVPTCPVAELVAWPEWNEHVGVRRASLPAGVPLVIRSDLEEMSG